MLIKDSISHKFDIVHMDSNEASIMILFLESEVQRHTEDIIMIEKAITFLKKKHNLS